MEREPRLRFEVVVDDRHQPMARQVVREIPAIVHKIHDREVASAGPPVGQLRQLRPYERRIGAVHGREHPQLVVQQPRAPTRPDGSLHLGRRCRPLPTELPRTFDKQNPVTSITQ
jgi:hypothetical protein